MTPAKPSNRDEVLYAFAVAHPVPDPEALDAFTKLYPEHADALTRLAVELMLEASQDSTEPVQAAAADAVSPAVARAISHYQNAVYELETKSAAAVPNPFDGQRQDAGLLADAPKVPVDGKHKHWGRDEFHRFAREVLANTTDATSVCVRLRYNDGESVSYETFAPSSCGEHDQENWA